MPSFIHIFNLYNNQYLPYKMSHKLDHPDFVYLHDINPNIIQVPRYATEYNFTGKPMRGYQRSTVVVTNALGKGLDRVQKRLDDAGYTLVVYDAYRPHKAVEHYLEWIDEKDMKTQELYFPLINSKVDLINEDYLSRVCPHSRGGSADVSIIKKGKNIVQPQDMVPKTTKLENSERTILFLDDGTEFMGTHFDFFDVSSHWDTNLITEEAQKNRQFLLKVMNECGFRYFERQWWHFYLNEEPYPQSCFDFDIV